MEQAIGIYPSASVKTHHFWAAYLEKYVAPGHPLRISDEPGSERRTVKSISAPIKNESVGKVNLITKGNELSNYIIFLSSVYLLIHKYCDVDDILIKVPVFENDMSQSRENVFVRMAINEQLTFKEFVSVVKNEYLRVLDYSESGLEDGIGEQIRERLISCRNQRAVHPWDAHGGLVFTFNQQSDAWELVIEFSENHYDNILLTSMVSQYNYFLENLLADVNQALSDIYFLSPDDHKLIVRNFNSGIKAPACEEGIHSLFYSQVVRTPDAVALEFGDQQLTYREVWRGAKSISSLLLQQSNIEGQLILISGADGPGLIQGALAIMMSGGMYLPVDPSSPEKRIEYILRDSNVKVALAFDDDTRNKLRRLMPSMNVINASRATASNAGEELADDQFTRVKSLNAYSIYTSGTTGNPKAAIVSHVGAVNTLKYRIAAYGLSQQDICLQLFSFAFDGFVTSAFSPLLSGGRLILLEKENAKNTIHIAGTIIQKLCTHLISVPLLFEEVISKFQRKDAQYLKTAVLAGDKMSERLFRIIEDKNLKTEIVNEYGVTEASVLSTLNRNVKPHTARVIGRPIANHRMLIVDAKDRILPMGIPGELVIAGLGVAEGYLNDPERTRKSFIHDHATGESIVYKTGDKARWMSDGTIELLGRIDDQVNLNGYRIEVGEVEHAIRKHPCVSAVFVKDVFVNQSVYLCAYVVLSNAIGNLKDEMGRHLSTILPAHMIPSHFVEIDRIPVNGNGKPDRKLLPEIVLKPELRSNAPESFYEKELAAAWKQVLESGDAKNVSDNFFENGGHSLSAISLATILNEKLQIKLDLIDIFDHPVFQDLAAKIGKLHMQKKYIVRKAEEREFYDLTPAQQDLFLAQAFYLNSTNFNMPFAARVRGKVDSDKIAKSIEHIIQRHGALRSSFHFEPVLNKPVRMISEQTSFELQTHKVTEAALSECVHSLIVPFDLSKAPLMHAAVIDAGNDTVMFFDFHHIICDGYSIEIFYKELLALYSGASVNEKPRYQFTDYLQWQLHLTRSGNLAMQQDFWLQKLSAGSKALSFDKQPGEKKYRHKGQVYKFNLGKGITEKLSGLTERNGSTLFFMLFPMFNLFLSKLSDSTDFVVGTPLSARDNLGDVMGMLVNMLPVRVTVDTKQTFRQYSEQFKQDLLESFRNKDYGLDRIVGKLRQTQDLQKNEQLFRIVFSFDNNIYKLKHAHEKFSDMSVEPYDLELNSAPYEFYLIGVLLGDDICFAIEYSTDVFNDHEIAGLSELFVNLICDVVEDDSQTIEGLRLRTNSQEVRQVFDSEHYF